MDYAAGFTHAENGGSSKASLTEEK
jgi:hypothetical protein